MDHFGWYGDNIDKHIKHLEDAEQNKSKLRSKIMVPLQPQVPEPTPSPAQAQPAPPAPMMPVTPLPECTPAELGLETGEKYDDTFEKDLAALRDGIKKTEEDPRVSQFAPEIKRREALNADQMDQEFLKALQGLKLPDLNPPQEPGNPQGNPFATSNITIIKQSGFIQPPKDEQPTLPQFGGGQTGQLPEAPLHQVSGWGVPGRGAFDSMAPVIVPIKPEPSPGFNMSRNFEQKPAAQDSLNNRPDFGLAAFAKAEPVPVPSRPQRAQLSDSALITLLRRVGI